MTQPNNISITFKPLKKQYIALEYLNDKTTQQVLYGGSAGSGKSYFGCAWIIMSCLRYPGARYLIGRSKLGQLRSTTMKTFTDICKEWGLQREVHYTWNGQSNEIHFYNGSEVILKDLYHYPSDKDFDSLGSLEITGCFIDEASQIVEKARDVITSRLRYKLDEFGIIGKVLMTCNPSKNFLYRDFYQPHLKGELDPYKQFIPALPTDNPNLPESYIETLRNMDKTSRERLLFGNWEFDDDPSTLIEYGQITSMFTNYHIQQSATDQKYITADIAAGGPDSTVILVWQGLKIIEMNENKLDLVQSAKVIKDLQIKHGIQLRNIIIDGNGVGLATIAQLKGSVSFLNNGKPLNGENYNHLKSQCYFILAEHINAGAIWFAANVNEEKKQRIIDELGQVKRNDIDSDGKRKVVDKATMKEHLGHSPDFADALMMRMWYQLQPTHKYGSFRVR